MPLSAATSAHNNGRPKLTLLPQPDESEHALRNRMLLLLARAIIGVCLLAWAVQEIETGGHVGDMGLLAEWMPALGVLAWVAAALFFVAGVATITGYGLRSAATLTGVVFAVSGVLRFTQYIPQMGHVWAYRGVAAEMFACAAGMAMLAALSDGAWPREAAARRLGAVGLAVFGAMDVVLGTIHYQEGPLFATLVPAWMPARLFLAYFTGTAMTAAGVAFLARRWVRPAGLWLALMFSLWVVTLHGPRIAHALSSVDEWNSGLVCLCFAGWALAAAMHGSGNRDQGSKVR